MMHPIVIYFIALLLSSTATAAPYDAPLLVRAVTISKKPFNIAFSGTSKQFGTVTNFAGKVRGESKNRQVLAKFTTKFRGASNSLGFKGGYSGEQKGSYRQSSSGAFAKGTQTFLYDGKISGMRLKMRTNAVFRLEMRNNRFKYTERGSFTAKATKGTYKAYFSNTRFKVDIRGIRGGKKFRFKYSGDYSAFADLVTMKTTGQYRGIVDGKRVTASLNFPSESTPV